MSSEGTAVVSSGLHYLLLHCRSISLQSVTVRQLPLGLSLLHGAVCTWERVSTLLLGLCSVSGSFICNCHSYTQGMRTVKDSGPTAGPSVCMSSRATGPRFQRAFPDLDSLLSTELRVRGWLSEIPKCHRLALHGVRCNWKCSVCTHV